MIYDLDNLKLQDDEFDYCEFYDCGDIAKVTCVECAGRVCYVHSVYSNSTDTCTTCAKLANNYVEYPAEVIKVSALDDLRWKIDQALWRLKLKMMKG